MYAPMMKGPARCNQPVEVVKYNYRWIRREREKKKTARARHNFASLHEFTLLNSFSYRISKTAHVMCACCETENDGAAARMASGFLFFCCDVCEA